MEAVEEAGAGEAPALGVDDTRVRGHANRRGLLDMVGHDSKQRGEDIHRHKRAYQLYVQRHCGSPCRHSDGLHETYLHRLIRSRRGRRHTAYEIEIPGTFVMAVPGPFTQLNNGDNNLYFGSNNPPVMAIAQGTCPTTSGSFNWVMVPPTGWCSGDTQGGVACPNGTSIGPAYGTAQITVSGGSYGMTVQPYLLSGTLQAPFTMTGATCSDGVISGIDSLGRSLNVAFTPSGLFFIDLPRGQGSMVGADASTSVNFTDFLRNGRTYVGWNFLSVRDLVSGGSPYSAPVAAPVEATANGTAINGTSFTDLDSGTLVQGSGAGATLNLVSQPSPGLIKYTAVMSDGTHDGVFVVKQIGGKYYFFSVIDHWDDSGADEMAGENIFGIETSQ